MSARSNRLTAAWALVVALAAFCLAYGAKATPRSDPRYTGRVLYRANRAPVPGVLVEIVEAEDDGRPGDKVLGSAHTDTQGRFMVDEMNVTDEPVTLAVFAVRESADSGGDRRSEGYEVKTQRTLLGFLPHPSLTKPNTILIEHRRPGRGGGESDD